MLCQSGVEETLQHFLKDCEALWSLRTAHGVVEMQVNDMLFGDVVEVEAEHRRRYLVNIWRRREKLVEALVVRE